jgi:gliding motility-associated-like protein
MVNFTPPNRGIYLKLSLYFTFLFIFIFYPLFTQAQFVRKGDAVKLSEKCFKITEDNLNRYGSIWWENKIDLTKAFELNFILYLGSKDGTGADGIAFLFHNDPRGFNATGAVAGGLGYGVAAEFPDTPPISPSVAIEFDTYDNNNDDFNQGFDYGDVPADHSTVVYNGQVSSPAFPPVWINPADPDVENSQCQTYRITWNPATQELKLFFNNQLRFNHTGDIIKDVFHGETSVYYGFTGSTGGLSNEQTLCLLDPESEPEAQDDVAATELAKPVTIPVTLNDKHSRGEAITLTNIVSAPKNGVVTIAGQNIIYTPADGFVGTDTFTYEICEASSSKCYSRCATATVTITVTCPANLMPQVPVISAAGPTNICENGSVTLTVQNQMGLTYQWQKDGHNIGTNSPTFTATEPGQYTLEIANNCGKVAGSNTIMVTRFAAPLPAFITASGPTTICGNSKVILSVPPQPAISYQWKKDGSNIGSNSPDLTVTESGVYTIEISNSCGQVAGNYMVSVTKTPLPAALTISASAPTTFCQTGNKNVLLTAPAQPDISYQWLRNGQNIGTNSSSLTVTESGEYSLVLKNTCGESTASANLILVQVENMPAPPIIRASGSTELCPGGSITLTAFPGGNQPAESNTGYNYRWSNGATGQSITVSEAGSYSVILVTAGACEIASTATKVTMLPVLLAPTIKTEGATEVCGSGSLLLSVPLQAGANYQWQKDGQPVGTNNPTITATEAGVYTLQLTSACAKISATDSITFTVNPKPEPATITANGSTTFCGSGSVHLSVPAQAGVTYQWQKDGQPIGTNTNTFTATETGEYTVQLTNNCGTQTATNKIKVESQPPLAPPVAKNAERCGPGNVTLTATGGASGEYRWYISATAATPLPGGTDGSFTTPALQTYSTYFVSVARKGCESERVPVTANILEALKVTVSPDIIINSGETTILQATGGLTYSWQPATGLSNPSAASPSVQPTETTTYTVTATNAAGCTAQAQVTVTVRQDLIIPTAISPNGDGTNETWEITNIQNFPLAHIEIFNRWGNKIYDTTNYRNNWDGTWQGRPLPVGTYFYVITLDKGRKLTGPISIVH